MDRLPQRPADGDLPQSMSDHRAWLLTLAALAAWQGWMTLTLYGPDQPWARLLDDQPIVSGRHPLHLYHGYLGSIALRGRGNPCCYDPNFQAGYPKTPVFDGGSRPAECFLLLAGSSYRPAAYKFGLAVCCAVVPLLLWAAGRGAGLTRAGAALAAGAGSFLWWGAPCRQALEAGDLDLLLAGLAALAQAGCFLRFHRAPGVGAWVGLLVSGLVGWFANPLLFALLLPLVLVYYLTAGVRHRLGWHAALFLGLALAMLGNAFWLIDWLNYWWLRSPLRLEGEILPHRTLRELWEAPLWGDALDRAFAVTLLVGAAAGAWLWNRRRDRAAARLFGLGTAGFVLLACVGIGWEPLGRLGATRLIVPALLFAVVPAAHAAVESWRGLSAWGGKPWRAAVVGAALVLAVGLLAEAHLADLGRRCLAAEPLRVGLEAERDELCTTLTEYTSAEARILWEDRPERQAAGQWTALLPLLTGRSYVGGLDAHPGIEHGYASFGGCSLAGRPLSDWSDADLEGFCRRYNVGWVVCWSPAAVARFRAWPDATVTSALHDDGEGTLFTIRRPLSYTLKGQAQWLHADSQRIALGEVTPEGGEVVLSLHHQTGMRASPSQVRVDAVVDRDDPVPFVRLRTPARVTRVVLTWENR